MLCIAGGVTVWNSWYIAVNKWMFDKELDHGKLFWQVWIFEGF